MPTISELRQAALDFLKAGGSAMSAAAETIDFYHGEAQDLVAEAPNMTVNFPACFVLYGGSSFGGRSSRVVDNWQLMLVYIAQDSRDADRMEQMDALIEAGKALHGQNFGLGISPLMPVSVRMVRLLPGLSIYSHQFSTFFV